MDILSNYNSNIQNMRAPSSRRKSTLLMNINQLIYFVTLTILFRTARGVELTFELPDNAKECFYEVIEEGKTSTVEFQVSQARKLNVFLSNLCMGSLIPRFTLFINLILGGNRWSIWCWCNNWRATEKQATENSIV